jgi:hypothetical protein
MANYVFAYSGGKGVAADGTERDAQYAQWGAWFAALGSAVVELAKDCPVLEIGGAVDVYEAIVM